MTCNVFVYCLVVHGLGCSLSVPVLINKRPQNARVGQRKMQDVKQTDQVQQKLIDI